MRLSSLVSRIGGDGAQAWEVHGRALQRRRDGDDIILLSIGDHDFSTAIPIIDAMDNAARLGRTHYAPIRGTPELRRAIAEYHRRWDPVTIASEEVSVVAGAQCGLYVSIQCIADPGDDILVLAPAYATYEAVIRASGARMVPVPLKIDGGFLPDLEALERAVTPKTRAILLNSPHNPTGMVLSAETMEKVAAICQRHDLWLISDEVYAALCYDRLHRSPRGLPGMAARTIVISSLSKSHAMTGWRVGWIVAPKDLQNHIGNLLLCMLYGLPLFIQEAAVKALEIDPAPMRDLFRARRDAVISALAADNRLTSYCPDSGMFIMIDIRSVMPSAIDFATDLLAQTGISVLPGDGFGPAGQGFVRLSLAAPENTLIRASREITIFAASKVGNAG